MVHDCVDCEAEKHVSNDVLVAARVTLISPFTTSDSDDVSVNSTRDAVDELDV